MRGLFLKTAALCLSLALCLVGCSSSEPTISIEATPAPAGSLHVMQTQAQLSGAQSQPLGGEASPLPGETPAPSAEETASPFPTENPDAEKICYLTFDDGPSKNTEQLLAVLAEKQVPATFFILGTNADAHPERVKAIADAGHLVANHSYSHKTDEIYQSLDALLADIQKCADSIHAILGDDYPTDLFRFPTGSTNKKCRDYREGVKAAGYRYFDWNALNGDAETHEKRSPEELMARLQETIEDVDGRKKEVIVLMHDTNSKENTVLMLGDAIDYLRSLGYEFRTLKNAQMH